MNTEAINPPATVLARALILEEECILALWKPVSKPRTTRFSGGPSYFVETRAFSSSNQLITTWICTGPVEAI